MAPKKTDTATVKVGDDVVVFAPVEPAPEPAPIAEPTHAQRLTMGQTPKKES